MHYSFLGKDERNDQTADNTQKRKGEITLTLKEGPPEFQIKQSISQSASRDRWALDSQ